MVCYYIKVVKQSPLMLNPDLPQFYCVFTSPVRFTKSLEEASNIAHEYFERTGYVVAIEQAQGGHYA